MVIRRTPHDALFKFTFRDPKNAASALRGLLPKRVRDQIDFSTLRVAPGSFVDPKLQGRFSDRLFVVQLAGREACIHVVYEHQSRPDPWMPLRMIEYIVLIWRDWLREHPNATHLPAVLPIVLHHGEAGWTTPKSLTEMYDLDPAALSVLGPWLPQLRLLIDDLAHVPVDALEARGMTGMAFLTMLCLKLGRTEEDLAEWFERTPQALRDAWAAGGEDALIALIVYTMQVNGAEEARLKSAAGRAIGAPAEEVVMTVAQRIREEVREAARAEGREEGHDAGQRELLSKLIRQRFGPLDADQQARLDGLDLGHIDPLIERIFVAQSFEDLLGPADADVAPTTAAD